MRPRPYLRPLAAALALLIGLSACDSAQGPGGAPQGGPPPMPVTVVVATSGDVLLKDRLPGRVVAARAADVRPQVDGVVERRLFEEGAAVAAGQPLYQIEPGSPRAVLKAAKAELSRAEATYAQAKQKLDRYELLLKSEATSRQLYEETVAAAAQSKAAVEAARAQLDVAAIDLTFTKVTAPISGIIGRSSVSEGALVTANQPTPMATITQLDPIYIDLTQSSVKLVELRQKIAEGTLRDAADQTVTLLLDGAGRTYPHQGRLQLSEVIVDQTTDSVSLRAEFPNPDNVLLPGMFVRAEVAQGRMDQGFLIPQKAVLRAPNGEPFVWIVGEGDKVARRGVMVERAIGGDWLIKKGLANGDRVIVEGTGKVRDGAAVAPQTTAEAAAPPPAKPQ